jgi:type II secretory pathway pseudopilin PulG
MNNFARGLSLLETIIWIGMFTMAMGAIVSSMLFFYRTSNSTLQEATAITSAQRGIDTMMRAIREVSYASDGAYPVVSIAEDGITFYANVDSDSGIERVHFYVQGTNLYEAILDPSGDPPVYSGTEAAMVLAENVQNIANDVDPFSYFDEDGIEISDYSDVSGVRFVTANILVDVDTVRPPTAVNIRSSAAMRNIIGN